MTDPSAYTYPSPLAGYENLPSLPEEKVPLGEVNAKSYINPQTGILSKSYEKFVEPLDNGIRGALSVFLPVPQPKYEKLTGHQKRHSHLLLPEEPYQQEIRQRTLGENTARMYTYSPTLPFSFNY